MTCNHLETMQIKVCFHDTCMHMYISASYHTSIEFKQITLADTLVKTYKTIPTTYCKLKILNFYFPTGLAGIVRFFGISDPKGLLSAPKGPTVTPYFPESELMPFACVIQSSVSGPCAFICQVQPPNTIKKKRLKKRKQVPRNS